MLLARDQHGAPHFSRIVNAMTTRLTSEPATITDRRAQPSFLGFSLAYFLYFMPSSGYYY